GRYQRPGPMPPISDRGAARRLLAEQLEAEHRQTEAARQRLATGTPTRLSDLNVLDREQFGLFLTFLADALSAGPPTPDGIRTVTSDGTLEIQLVPTRDGAVFEMHPPDGIFGGGDHLRTITVRPRPGP